MDAGFGNIQLSLRILKMYRRRPAATILTFNQFESESGTLSRQPAGRWRYGFLISN